MFESLTESVHFISAETGDVTGERYEGVFEVRKVLSPAQKALADKLRRDFLGNPLTDESIDNEVAELAYATSQVTVRVVKGPKWYSESNGLKNFLDQNILIELTKQILEIEFNFKQSLKEKAKKAREELTSK